MNEDSKMPAIVSSSAAATARAATTAAAETTNWDVCEKRRRQLGELMPATRQKLLADVDGSKPLIFDELSAIVAETLRMMDEVLLQMTSEETATFRLACQQSPNESLATDRSLRLKFLRAESFQPGLAAHRLTQYFDLVNKLFGSDALGKTLTVHNLTGDDMAAMGSGGFQTLQETDQAGRKICFYNERSSRCRTVDNMLRAIFYIVDVTSRDINVQQRGLVSLMHYIEADLPPHAAAAVKDNLLTQYGTFMRFASPVRFVAMHVVSNSTAVLDVVTPTLNRVLSKDLLLRMIVHHTESNAEMLEKLHPFDFPIFVLASMFADDGELLLDHHINWMRMRYDAERSVLVPAPVPPPQQQQIVVQPNNIAAVAASPSLIEQRAMIAQYLASQQAASAMQAFGGHIQPGMPGGNGNFQLSYSPNDVAMANLQMLARTGNLPGAAAAADARSPPVAQLNQAGASPPTEAGQSSRPSSLPTVLYLDSDLNVLSSYQCQLRRQIQVFQANEFDVECCTSRMNRVIRIGQVGLRCRHCAGEPEWKKAPGSVYYPGALDVVYQVGQNLAKNHLLQGCNAIPDSIRAELIRLRSDKSRASAGKVYWKNAGAFIGLCESEEEDGGLYFRAVMDR